MTAHSSLVHRWRLWLLRAVWLTLPLTAGPALEAATRSWSEAARTAAEALLWVAWGIGLLATLAPRPPTLTALRALAPVGAAVAILAAIGGEPSGVAAVGAVVATIGASVLASGHDIALASANSLAYGDEVRVPLRTPPALFLAPLPLARVAVVASIAVPVLLLADGRVVAGLVTLGVGIPVFLVLARALSGLSRRWTVLVPAGIVVLDPMTLADPVLFPRERVVALTAAPAAPIGGATDLRLGATRGSVEIRCNEPAVIGRARRGRRASETVRTDDVVVAIVRREAFLQVAAAHRIRVPE
jgi:hypothetical protein